MTNYQDLADDHVREWIHMQVSGDLREFERTSRALAQLIRHRIYVTDVLFVLRHANRIAHDYPGGCISVRGTDVDRGVICVVIAPPSEKNRIKVVTVWRE